ncbi:MAG: hypothetical protein IIY93_06545 [Clostridia bacterium]|nr:hypothetical protein [Clostridia bacterium]MBQ4395893.1 hypothetical protein [Clostridia bacterium]
MSRKKPTHWGGRPTEIPGQYPREFPDSEEADWDNLDSDAMNVVSGAECTGMVPSAPIGDSQANAYREIYDVPVTQEPYLFDRGQKRP